MTTTSRKNEFGQLAKEFGGLTLPLEILRSQAGWYIGTRLKGAPYSRESAEYYPTDDAAERALNTRRWTQRPSP
jgi:hypothetical protein